MVHESMIRLFKGVKGLHWSCGLFKLALASAISSLAFCMTIYCLLVLLVIPFHSIAPIGPLIAEVVALLWICCLFTLIGGPGPVAVGTSVLALSAWSFPMFFWLRVAHGPTASSVQCIVLMLATALAMLFMATILVSSSKVVMGPDDNIANHRQRWIAAYRTLLESGGEELLYRTIWIVLCGGGLSLLPVFALVVVMSQADPFSVGQLVSMGYAVAVLLVGACFWTVEIQAPSVFVRMLLILAGLLFLLAGSFLLWQSIIAQSGPFSKGVLLVVFFGCGLALLMLLAVNVELARGARVK